MIPEGVEVGWSVGLELETTLLGTSLEDGMRVVKTEGCG